MSKFFASIVFPSYKNFLLARKQHVLSALKWVIIIIPMALIVGSLCAFFLYALEWATKTRFDHPELLWALPFAGVAISFLYQWKGSTVEGGNNLLIDQIHEPGGGVPLRMAPLILFSTVATHLFGGSAGREGTAVQLGGSIAGAITRALRLDRSSIRILLMAGIAAGFGAVFGTPVAGAIFALEVLTIGRIQYDALIPCLIAAIIADWTCHQWGIEHTAYHIAFMDHTVGDTKPFHIDLLLLLKVSIAGISFGLAGLFFSEASHIISSAFKRFCPIAILRPFIGGCLVIGLVYLLGTNEYLGLGVWSPNTHEASIVGFINGNRFSDWAWFWKIIFTVITLGSGFKGGEVTPLFFIGAALGSTLSFLMGAPPDLLSALGFVAIFAAASNTPLACTIMGIELFGATHAVYIATACFIAYLCSGNSGIYLSQRIGISKHKKIKPDTSLRQIRQNHIFKQFERWLVEK